MIRINDEEAFDWYCLLYTINPDMMGRRGRTKILELLRKLSVVSYEQ